MSDTFSMIGAYAKRIVEKLGWALDGAANSARRGGVNLSLTANCEEMGQTMEGKSYEALFMRYSAVAAARD